MKCQACAGLIPDDAVFCPSCGTDVRSSGADATDAREHKVALAAANLLRLRRRWSEAEARCIEVLRADPNDLHAHSLLGDIYADQGRLEDAAQWYQLALDLDPKSRPDREKLARLRREAAPASADGGISADATVLGIETSLAARWIGLVLVVFLLGAAGAWMSQRGRGLPVRTPSAVGTTAQPPSAGIPSRSSGVGVASTRRGAGPVLMDAAADATADTEPDVTGIIEREMEIERRVRSGAALTERSVVAAVLLAVDGHSAAIVLGRHAPGDGVPQDRGEIVLDALTACQSAAHADPQIAFVDVTVRAPSGEPLFRGRAPRASLMSQSSSTTPDHAIGVFTAAWWPPDAT